MHFRVLQTVPSRLAGHRRRGHLHDDHLEVWLGGRRPIGLSRRQGRGKNRRGDVVAGRLASTRCGPSVLSEAKLLVDGAAGTGLPRPVPAARRRPAAPRRRDGRAPGGPRPSPGSPAARSTSRTWPRSGPAFRPRPGRWRRSPSHPSVPAVVRPPPHLPGKPRHEDVSVRSRRRRQHGGPDATQKNQQRPRPKPAKASSPDRRVAEGVCQRSLTWVGGASLSPVARASRLPGRRPHRRTSGRRGRGRCGSDRTRASPARGRCGCRRRRRCP